MATKITDIEELKKTRIEERVEPSPADKAWKTKWKKKIAEQQKQIEAKDMENSKLKKENRQLKREAKK